MRTDLNVFDEIAPGVDWVPQTVAQRPNPLIPHRVILPGLYRVNLDGGEPPVYMWVRTHNDPADARIGFWVTAYQDDTGRIFNSGIASMTCEKGYIEIIGVRSEPILPWVADALGSIVA